MRKVSSPTTRLVSAALAIGVAAAVLAFSPARAAAPAAPGDFTGFGFDTCVAPSQDVMDVWNLRSPYSAVGIYISGNSRYCGDKYQPHLSKAWVEKNAANGWRFIPIHVGYQAPCFKNNPKSRVQKKRMSYTIATARAQARADVAETIAALKKYGFGSASVSYLDIEWYDRGNAKCNSATIHFIDEWTESLHEAGYRSGLYSSGSAAIRAVDLVRDREWFDKPDHMWIAWTNKVANTDGGPYLRDDGWTSHQRIHQYHNGVDVTYGKRKLNIDKNVLDVGRGSVASKEPLPCSVPLSFGSYQRRAPGDRGMAVRALQCLLTTNGYPTPVDGTFSTGTLAALNAFRAAKGWKPAAHTTRPAWTALLAGGVRPRVLKQGSVGESVWRLQRAIVASGISLRITGVYDAKTVAAVKKYRTAQDLIAYTTAESSVWSALQRGRTVD